MNRKLPLKVLLTIITLFFSLYTFAQLPTFNFTVTKTDQTCLGNGSLTFAVSGTVPGATVAYEIYLLPSTTPTPTTNTTVTNLVAGNYKIVATQSLGGQSSSNTQNITINNLVIPLTYSLSFTKVRCGNDGTITVNVTTGTAVSYEIFAGPVIKPNQASNTFTGLPVGVYQVRVYDNCGEAVVVTHQLEQATTSINIDPVTFPGGPLPSCTTINAKNLIYRTNTNDVIFYPLTCQYTIFPPGGGAPIVVTTTMTSGEAALAAIPFYNDQQYTFNLKITDACGNVYNRNNNIVNQKFNLSASPSALGCGDNIFELMPNNYVAPYTFQFITSPAGFDPLALNPNHPTFSSLSAIYGGNGVFAPEGSYTVKITDACNRTVTITFEVEDPEVDPVISGEASDCSGGTGTITIQVPPRIIVHIEMTEAPAGYPAPLPQDVTALVGGNGFLMSGLPIGTYTFTFTDSCGDTYTEEIEMEIGSVEPQLIGLQRASCEIGYGSIRVTNPDEDLTNITITAAPPTFTEPLPFDGTPYITINDGRFYMDSLPAGTYTFESLNSCGQIITEQVTITGYTMTVNDIEIIPHCGSFDVELHHTSNGNFVPSFWLQKYNPAEGVWEHPATGQNYVEGTALNINNAKALTNNGITINNPFVGQFRIVKTHFVYDNGTSNNVRCVQELYNFTFDGGPVITSTYSFPCANNLIEVAIIATGVPPLLYDITSKNGSVFLVDNGESNLFTGLEAATYNFKVTDDCGNIRNILLDISSLDPLTIVPNGFCEGEDSSLTVPEFSFLSYEWWKEGVPGTILSTNGTLEFPDYDSTADAGVYIVSITSENPGSCINQVLEYEIGINALPDAGADTISPYCNNGLVIDLEDYIADGADTGGTWEDLGGTGVLNGKTLNTAGLAAGTYQFKYTATGLCNAADEATITLEIKDIPLPPALTVAAPVCVGDNIQLSAATVAGAVYNWTGPNGFASASQNPLITNATAAATGTYSLTVTVNGCTSVAATLPVTVNAAPRAGDGSTAPICNDGSEINLMNFITGPHDNNGAWEDMNAAGGLTNNIFNPEGVAAGTYQFKYTVTNLCNDTDEAIVTLELKDIPQVPAITGTEPVCDGDNIQLTANTIAGAVYNWTGPNGFTSAEQNPLITNAAAVATGTYSLTVTVNECTSAAAIVVITVNPAPRAGEGGIAPICNDGAAIDLMGFITGPHDNGGIWEDMDAVGGLTNNIFAPEGIAAGTYQFKYVVTNVCNDTDEAIVTIELKDIPLLPEIEEIAPLCEGSSIQLTTVAVPNGIYQWTGPNGFTSAEQNPVIENAAPAATGTYSLTVTVNGCTSPLSAVPVVVNYLPQFTVEGNTSLCDNQTTILSVIPANFEPNDVVYQWYYEGGLLPDVTSGNVEVEATGHYEVIVDNNGCTTAFEIEITHNDNPFELIVDSGCINYDYMLWVVNVSDIPGAVVTWTGPGGFNFTGTEANITNGAEGEYHVSVTNAEGCTVETVLPVDNTSCIIPKGISPNDDGKNDAFDLSNLDVIEIKIFNRYGIKIYESKNYKKEWYGQSDKGELPTGTYYYVITLSAGKQVTGWVYLQREIN